ncbi:MAG: C10 family peptidase [Bacteroidales bacterium]|nr:C10 family peptidase [Bacteroidales bacterium]
MKRILPVLTILLSFTVAKAAPVDVEEARLLGQQFANAHFGITCQRGDLSLVYSQSSFYVFNIGNTGFVILSSDDRYRPLVGYSTEGIFNPDDMAPALQDYLDGITASRSHRNAVQDPNVAHEWETLRRNGHVNEPYRGKDDSYLVETKWNQNYPYNYCCPVDSDGPGGHVYAGCVATAAAQLMRFWNFPAQGRGSYTYTPQDHPEYGPLTANFGETTYDWENMPVSINANSPVQQLEAVGQLIFHVGVSVDMNYRPGSSGATTSKLCTVMPQYFYYTDQMENIYREGHTHESYMALIIEAIDMGWPMVHRGGGHAYVLDGYNANGLVHFNWGWGGSGDAWFDIDNHNYTDGESVIYNYVPEDIYGAAPKAPSDLVVTPDEGYGLSATVSWVNPIMTLANHPLTSIDQIVVMRGNEVVFTEENVVPGATMSFVDSSIPCYDIYSYKVYSVVGGQRGRSMSVDNVSIGPSCSWRFVVSSTNISGWRGSYISVRNGAGHEAARVETSGSSPAVLEVDVPLGRMELVWVRSDDEMTNYDITINVKDPNNNSVYSYSGSMGEMEAGVFYEGNNGCGNAAPAGISGELTASEENGVVILNWAAAEKELIGYNVYRDGVLCCLTTTNEFIDEDASVGGHCYQVCVLGDGGESEPSNEVCATTGENCDAGSNLWFEMQENGKPIITWEAPTTPSLSGFAVYRKMNDGEYERVKLLAANKTEYKENKTLQDGNWYYYRVTANYSDIECESAPFKALYGNEYFVKIYYSLTNVEDHTESSVSLYPNPVDNQLTVEGQEITVVTVYDLLGQMLFEQRCESGTSRMTLAVDDLVPGMYLIRIQNVDGVTSQSFIKK